MKSSNRLARYGNYIRKTYISVKTPEFSRVRVSCLRSQLAGNKKYWIFYAIVHTQVLRIIQFTVFWTLSIVLFFFI
jgi:hypothetical protein